MLTRWYIKSEFNFITFRHKASKVSFITRFSRKKKRKERKGKNPLSINSKNFSRYRTRQTAHVLPTITGQTYTKTPVPRVCARQASGRTLPANLPGHTSPCPNIITRLDSVSNAIFDSFAGRIFPERVANCFHSLHEYRPAPGGNRLTLAPSLWSPLDLCWLSLSRVCPRFIHPGTAMFRGTVCTILAKFVEPVILINLLSGTPFIFQQEGSYSIPFSRVFQTRVLEEIDIDFFFSKRGLLRYINRWIISGSVCLTYI